MGFDIRAAQSPCITDDRWAFIQVPIGGHPGSRMREPLGQLGKGIMTKITLRIHPLLLSFVPVFYAMLPLVKLMAWKQRQQQQKSTGSPPSHYLVQSKNNVIQPSEWSNLTVFFVWHQDPCPRNKLQQNLDQTMNIFWTILWCLKNVF